MIAIESPQVYGWEAALRGMRNPLNSWDRSDSIFKPDGSVVIGASDGALCKKLVEGGAEHRKFLRMVTVTADITAPLYWWKEFDTYKVGTVANSTSTMHRLHARDLTLADFSCEHLTPDSLECLRLTVDYIDACRRQYIRSKDKEQWWQMIQLLPTSFNQKRTICFNYEALLNIYRQRRHHRLDEWQELCKWVETLPYFNEICLGGGRRD